MIIHLTKNIDETKAEDIAKNSKSILIKKENKFVLVSSSKVTKVPENIKEYVEDSYIFENDIQLASQNYFEKKREIKVGNTIFGGESNNTVVITGPCSVESEEQIEKSVQLLKSLGLTTLRAGSFKPRTSPYSFQGMGLEGLKLLAKIRDKHNLNIVTEVRDASHIDQVIEYADVVQIGAKAMYDQGILRKCGKSNKAILLKRGFGATLQEFVQAAEFVLSGGNENVMLCERGIRTFEDKTRFTLDLCGVSFLKEHTNLPVILDPSHAMGYAYGVPDLARACVAMGVDGLLIETHPNPSEAKSDAAQQLNHQEFTDLFHSLTPIAKAIGKNIL
ncbi:MAG: 3-deoxy-7-phosphoheptulonate synthase [Bacteroidota bacterium]|nr:3-deoxy-7-phosphoheptulonate synthase [Bacteroidota bacterium]